MERGGQWEGRGTSRGRDLTDQESINVLQKGQLMAHCVSEKSRSPRREVQEGSLEAVAAKWQKSTGGGVRTVHSRS